jgi:3-dehydroquinate dehydratase type I
VRPKICAVITAADEAAVATAAPLVDLFEVRIDLIGDNWPEVARKLKKPWIATNRLAAEGGRWQGAEDHREEELLKALDLGAAIIDLELATPGIAKMVQAVKKKARCLVSHHDFNGTPSFDELKDIVRRQLAAGANISKLVTTAKSNDDNLKLLRLYREFAGHKLVAFAMGEAGVLSRVLAPLAGAEFTYASLETGKHSAPGQLTVAQLAEIYGSLKV